jgi:hypothetical protein
MLKGWLNVLAACLVIAAGLYLSPAITVASLSLVVGGVYLGFMIIYLIENYQNKE